MGVKLQSALGGSVELNAPSTASNFTMTVPTTNGTVATTDQLQNFRNKIINGGLDIWQRGTSLSLTTTVYGPDRFQISSTSSSSVTRSTDVPSNLRSRYSMSVTSDQWGNGAVQIIEDLANYVNGKTYTISFWAKGTGASVGKTFKISIGWAPEDPNLKTLSSEWQYYTRTITFASNFRAINGAGDNLYLAPVRSLDGANLASGNTVLITQIQMEEGSVATPFEQRPIGLELALCQRYYEQYGPGYRVNLGVVTSTGSAQQSVGGIQWLVPKRTNPSVTVSGLWRTLGQAQGAAITLSFNEVTRTEALMIGTAASNYTSGVANHIQSDDSATGRVNVSAEL